MYKCSVITSIYNSEKFIKGFLENCLAQQDLESFEFLLLDAASDDRTQEIILSYELPENFIYKRLEKKYSIYETWNIGVDLASSEILTNWNTDDRKKNNSLKIQSNYMEINPECDVSYGYVAWSVKPNETYEDANLLELYPCEAPEKSFLLGHNSPHNMPFWRKSLHSKHGYFDTTWPTAADHEFWLRCHHAGANFQKINQIVGLYYYNPDGLSTGAETTSREEGQKIREIYHEKGY
jgi:glycosyltransferase involved in cell wall biosynthesis